MSKSNSDYDIIIIGSGMGALTVASIMAQYRHKKVLLLERHFTAGGFTHTFKRKRKFHWDVGIHYVGDLAKDSVLGRIFDLLTRGKMKWAKMPHIFEKFVYPDFTFEVKASREEYQGDLIKQFPDEAESIERYFDDMKTVNTYWGRHITLKGKPAFTDLIKQEVDLNGGFKHPNISVKEYLDKNFKSQQLKALLVSQWGDYGVPPAEASLLMHATIVLHYLNGGYYPVGTSARILETIQPIIEEFGGKILVNHQVEEILIEGGQAKGVRVKHTRAQEGDGIYEYYADTIISNAGAYTTYNKLIPQSEPISFRDELNAFYKKQTIAVNVGLYLGLKDDPRKLGFNGENYWIYTSYDHDENCAVSSNWIEQGKPSGCYLTFPALKDPEAEAFTAEIIAFTTYDAFAKWKDEPWKKRDGEYKKLKDDIADMLINFVNERYPGFADLIEFRELSTPVTTEHFTDHPQGSIYGVPGVVERFTSKTAWCNAETPIENLYLTGADVSSVGVAGAVMGGMATISKIPDGLSMLKIMKTSPEQLAAKKIKA